jgi:hypothetical protein
VQGLVEPPEIGTKANLRDAGSWWCLAQFTSSAIGCAERLKTAFNQHRAANLQEIRLGIESSPFCNRFPYPTCLRRSEFESPQLHQEVAANHPGFPTPTIPRLFSALARRLMVCGVYSAGTTGLGRRTRK